MPFEIRPVQIATLPFIADCFLSNQRNPLLKVSVASDEDKRKFYEESHARILENAELTKKEVLLRVHDTDTGRDAAFAHWVLPQDNDDADPFRTGLHFPGSDPQLTEEIMREYKRSRKAALKGRQFFLLHNLITHPDFSRQGAASLLIRWAFEEADKRGVPCILGTRVKGFTVQMYEKHGFRVVGGYEVDTRKYGADELAEYVQMLREPVPRDLLRAAILVVSDTAAQDASNDRAGPVLRDVFKTEGGGATWDVGLIEIVPDNLEKIRAKIVSWCGGQGGSAASPWNIIVTTGGTGFAVKDVTPEAVEPLLERKASGLVHMMLSTSLQVTPFAAMARPVAGSRGKTLIITLPGSPKGAKENLQAIIKLLPHACQQAAGADSRSLHAGGVAKLEKEAGLSATPAAGTNVTGHNHGHNHHNHQGHHGHHHGPAGPHTKPEDRPVPNDPEAGPSSRHRESPYPMLSVSDALDRMLAASPTPTVIEKPVNTSLVGSILAEDVTAASPVPAFRASIVDGYAVVVSQHGTNRKGTFPVASVSHAAPGSVPALEPDKIARITTGAPLPPNATAVVMVEDTVLRKLTLSGKEEAEVEVLTDKVKDGENVREVGSDIAAGEIILRKGDRVSAVGGELGLLAAVGRAKVKVYQKPVVGVMSTGDEIVPHDREGDLKLGEVRDTNRITLMSAISGWGYDVIDLGIARDARGDLESTLRVAFRKADVIVTTGGVSMGELDLLKPTIEHSLGGTIHFGRVAMKPGKPTTFATVPFKSTGGDPKIALVFSLPGNPASGMVTASLFVRPCLDHTSGVARVALGMPRVKVVLAADVRSDPKREEYQRAAIWQGKDGRLFGETTGGQRSSRIGSFKAANGLLIVAPDQGVLPKGQVLEGMLLSSLSTQI